ncbi:hypothetical protein EW093_07490 [Thiospirochaeta perfilievii]|uniref:histidine kinase n=1 Tax=Thiospirochaeta perfilievii TaxID=252967 RepID=A0A5C1QBU5_9SPIO|nr:histidine kinase N-terminal 7TM domain-containing protein [Thiospirochaeta perfilievii]QEN04550.1 hypothetical protein EW093_07490 [Thiospirochaeta perfilievii]
MLDLPPYERLFIFALIPVHLLSLLLAIAFLVLVLIRAKDGDIKRSFILFHSLIIIWLIGKISKTVAPTLPLRWWSNVFYYIGILPLGASLFIFSRSILGRGIKKWYLFYIPAILFFIVLVTNPIHYQFYKKYTFATDRFGSLFYIHFIITYIFSLIGIINLFVVGIRERKEFKKSISLIIGASIPLIVNMNYILDVYNPMYDITPIAYNISLIILGFAAFKHDFFDFIPQALAKSLNSLPGSIELNNCKYGRDDIAENKLSIVKKYRLEKEDIIIKRVVSIEDIINKQNELHSIISKKKLALEVIEKEREEKLKGLIFKERLRLSGEIHDILGYSVSSIISLLEIARIKNLSGEKYKKHMQQILSLSDEGVRKLKKSLIVNIKNSWKKEFQKLLWEIEDHGLKVTKHMEQYNSNQLYQLLYKILREAFTNILKYSKADEITIILTKLDDFYLFNIIDNGIGCKSITPGTGMNNMKQRAKNSNSTIVFNSTVDAGFFISLKIPIKNYIDEFSE